MPVELLPSIEAVAADWDELAVRLHARPWLRSGWFACWSRAFQRDVQVLAARRDGRLVGILPLVQRGRVLRSAANWHTPEFGMLAEDAAARRELAAAALDQGALDLWLLDRAAGGLEELRDEAARRGRPSVERVQLRSPWIPVEGSFEGYLRERGPTKKRRKELDRCRRRLAEHEGPVELEVHTHADEELLAQGYSLEGSGWKSAQGTAVAADPGLERFYDDLARWAESEGMLRLCFLRAGARRVAFEYVLEDGRSLYDVKGGYDTSLREHSPGLLLAAELIRVAHERGLASVELLGDAEPFKLVWTERVRERVRFQSFPRTPAGVAGWALQRYARPLAARALRR